MMPDNEMPLSWSESIVSVGISTSGVDNTERSGNLNNCKVIVASDIDLTFVYTGLCHALHTLIQLTGLKLFF